MNPVGPIDSGDEKPVRKSSNQHHPTYLTMIKSAILALNDTKGASKAAILKYIARNYELGENLPVINTHIRNALKKGLDNGEVKQTKGHGASGSFTVAPAHNMKKKVEKPKAKAKAKTVKAPKKAVKKTAKKMPTKAAKAPKAKKTAKKASVKKTTLDKKSKKISKKPKAKVAKKTGKVAKKA
ncbi:unnamed protein product [Auanema sp. JU1783]|nr:unnamed protein product [Auanema sp. JU1783]